MTTLAGRMPETSGTLIQDLLGGGRAALDKICLRYWKPVVGYVRAGWRIPGEEAKDLTQDFFLRLVKDGSLANYSPDRGGLRSYLKSLLRHFLADRARQAAALKRGGGARFVSVDEAAAASEGGFAFDLEWRRELIARAMSAVEAECASRDRRLQWKAFEAFDLVPVAERPTYAGLAEQLGVRESDVRRGLFAVRSRLREAVRQEVSRGVRDPSEFREEWSALFGE